MEISATKNMVLRSESENGQSRLHVAIRYVWRIGGNECRDHREACGGIYPPLGGGIKDRGLEKVRIW